MKKITSMLLLAAVVLASSSCHKTTEPKTSKYPFTGNYFIIGHSGGFTVANAPTTYYLVNNGEKRKDMTHLAQAVPPQLKDLNFHFRCDLYEYNSVADLPSSIPSQMLNQNDETLGFELPDAGFTDVRASINGTTYHWRIEAGVAYLPDNIQQFINRLRTEFP